MANGFQYDVFLSHNAKDKPRVRQLAERLRTAGLRVWFDEWVIKPGDDIYLAIERGLEVSRTLVLCLSPAALGSDWVGLERSTVLFRDPSNAGRRFIPLLLADCKLPDTLRRYKYVDFRQEADAAFDELLRTCSLQVKQQPSPTEAPQSGKPRAALAGRVKHTDPLFSRTGTIQIGALKLCATLRTVPPLQEDDVKKNYKGFWVLWWTTFSSASTHWADPELCRLQLLPEEPEGYTTPVECTVRLADYPILKVLQRGSRLRVFGQIGDFQLFGVQLENVNLEFPEKDQPSVLSYEANLSPPVARTSRTIEQRTNDDVMVEQEIERFLSRNNLVRPFDGTFIEIFPSPEARGWERREVSHKYVGEYAPPPEMNKLMERFKPTPPIREYFGLHRCSPLLVADGNQSVQFELVGGTYHHNFTLNAIFENRHTDPDCRRFRTLFEDSWVRYSERAPLEGSPLYHHVTAEVLVLSSDNQLVLGKRSENLRHGGSWSTSIEEQMVRKDPEKPYRKDKHIFDAPERGVDEELGIEVIPYETRLLKVGVAWSNFTAIFVFLVRCNEEFDDLVKRWKEAKHDPNEAVALDCLEATSENISDALNTCGHTPSRRYAQRVVVGQQEGYWHPTAHARLRALYNYLQFLRKPEE